MLIRKIKNRFTLFSLHHRPFYGLLVVLISIYSSAFAQTTVPFNYTGGTQTFTVPCGVHLIHVKAWGGGGSGGGADDFGGAVGGAGAFVESDFAVNPGQVITLVVGGGAGPGANCTAGTGGGPSGWGNGVFDGGSGGNAGGSGCSGGGGGGGGGSGVFDGGTLLMVAGGGGGGSGGGQHSSGATGGGGGVDGNASPGSCASPGISGASPNGIGLPGANKGGADGGGGGYLGSSGGGVAGGCDCGACGGGGGTSWASGTNTIIANGSGQTPGNGGDPDRPAANAIGGGTSTKGGDGFIAIVYTGGPPTANFTNTTVCNSKETVFTNTSTTPGSLTSVEWNYGNNAPLDTASNPHYIYPLGGTYNVTLITHNIFGCADTVTKSVQVYYTPTASFTFTEVCYKDSTHFLSTSSIDPGSSITTYLWDFNDGGPTSNLQNPVHIFSVGTFTTQLIVTSPDMCADTSSFAVSTYDPPKSVFSVINTCLYDSAKLTNSSLDPTMGTIASWAWDFGDGSSINTVQWGPHHLYTSPGDYDIKLITYSTNLGCSDTAISTITIYPMPHAGFSAPDVCLGESMTFTDTSSVTAPSTITGWSWNFGGSMAASTLQNPARTYTSDGTFAVTLIASTNNSCKDTVTQNVVVHPLPAPAFNPVNVCQGVTSVFNSLSTLVGPDVIALTVWKFGDSNFSISQDTTHLFATADTFNVQLLVVSSFGCADSITKPIVINPNPVVNFVANDSVGCAPLCISFTDASSIASGSNINWAWDFGDGAPLNYSSDVYHCYTNTAVYSPALYSPILTVTSDSNCVTTFTKNNFITVFPNPIANFLVDPSTTTIVNPVFTITNQSTGVDFCYWNFGDNDTSILSNPLTHTYADTGHYQLMLITSTQYGCVDTTYQTVIVEPDFVLYAPNAFTPNGDGINDSFGCKAIFVHEFKMSIFDRWGNLIFTSTSIDKPWDGKANNGDILAQQDVYIYSVEVTDVNLKKHSFKGVVTLVK
jgi:gliding motility-associated-like protein